MVHGNDVALVSGGRPQVRFVWHAYAVRVQDASGIDCLSEIKAMGKYKEFRRT